MSVGKVIAKSLDPEGNRTIATIQMNNKFAPIHSDARAILRQKTILGETYVQLTPGHARQPDAQGRRAAGALQGHQRRPARPDLQRARSADAGRLPQWQQQLALALKGNDQNLYNVIGNLPPFAADTTDLLQVLDVQHTAVVSLVQNGGTVFAALNKDPAALRNLITTGETTFHTTAANNNAIAATFHVFPTFLDETKATMTRLQSFAHNTDPLIKKLEPVAQQPAARRSPPCARCRRRCARSSPTSVR